MKIRETKPESDKLIEVGKTIEGKIEALKSNLQNANKRVAEARINLERVSQTDENGKTVGDVDSAMADLQAAMMDAEYYESELDATERELESINDEKRKTLVTLDEYTRVEEKNLSVLQQLQGMSFGENAATMAAAIVAQMNLAEEVKEALYRSMGMKYVARRNGLSPVNSSGGVSNGGWWRTIVGEHSSIDDLKKTNPNYEPRTQWSINCQRCVPTYEMRRRGYDVTSYPCPLDDDELSRDPFSVWESPEVLKSRSVADIKSKMKEWGDGARAQVVVVWGNTMDGHTFIAEQRNGETIFLEPQIPNLAGENVEDYFYDADPNRTWFCRIDNLEPTEKIKQCCREV